MSRLRTSPLNPWPPFRWGVGGPAYPSRLSRGSRVEWIYWSVYEKIIQTEKFGTLNTYITLDSIDDFFQKGSSPFLLIMPGARRAVDAQVDGSGRHADGESGSFNVVIGMRSIVDTTQEARIPIVARTYEMGIHAVEQEVKETLELLWPREESGDYVTEEPIRWLSSSAPIRHSKAREFVYITSSYEFLIARRLSDS